MLSCALQPYEAAFDSMPSLKRVRLRECASAMACCERGLIRLRAQESTNRRSFETLAFAMSSLAHS